MTISPLAYCIAITMTVSCGCSDGVDALAQAETSDLGTDAGGDGSAACAQPVKVADVQAGALSSCGAKSCHGVSAPFAAGLDLRSGSSYAALVGVPAVMASSMVRVKPGDPEHSFLWRVLRDELAIDGSQGMGMPLVDYAWEELPGDQLEQVRCWILQGAPQ
jgi:hypothetical protein